MSEVVLRTNLDANAILSILSQMSFEEKIRIYSELEKELRSTLANLITSIRKENQSSPMSLEEITREIEEVRAKRYDRNWGQPNPATSSLPGSQR